MSSVKKAAEAALSDDAVFDEDALSSLLFSDEILNTSGASCKGVFRYPPSKTDQLHNHSIAQMVRQGQGQVLEEDLNNYDFDEKRKDDGSLEVPSMFDSDWADPAEQFEKSAALNKEISSAIRKEIVEKQALADQAASTAMAQSSKKKEAKENARSEQ